MSPLANQNSLAQLNDIIAPTAASPWPPAPFYWVLLIISIIAIGGLIYIFKKIKKQRLKQQTALLKLRQLQTGDTNFIMLNQLIKGVALSYFPRQQVASLHGKQWFDFIQQYAADPIFDNQEAFLKRLYQTPSHPCCKDDFSQTKNWIKKLPKQINEQRKKANKNV